MRTSGKLQRDGGRPSRTVGRRRQGGVAFRMVVVVLALGWNWRAALAQQFHGGPSDPGRPVGAGAASHPGQGFAASAFQSLEWRGIGPNRGGRSIAVAGSAARPHEYYFGATGGGVWKSTNGGVSWFPVGDGQFRSSSVGAIAVCEANPEIVYVGFGEAQLRGNVIPGDGVYRTTDGGRTWTHLGLESSTGQQTISRLRVHPSACDVVYAAVLGDPFGPNEERGVYRSTDGGRTWTKVLYRSDRVGAVDLAMDPSNPRVLYATFWEVYRKPWLLHSGGEGGGLFKSTDGGDTWTELTANPGLPRPIWGKAAVSVSGADPNRVYANIEAVDGGVFASDDAGATWVRTSGDRNLRTRAFYYTRINADPQDRETVYVLNEDFWRSRDGGRTWEEIGVPHGDNHDLWIAPTDNQRMIQANDGGANVSVDAGATWTGQLYPTAQMYTVKATSHFPYHVCGAQQDNATACVPSDGDGSWWYAVGGGESGWVTPHPADPDIYYAGSQTTQLTRLDRSTGQLRSIQPWPIRSVGRSAGEVRERFQWTFPHTVSPHDPEILYVGSQHLWRSTNRGESWERISPDLTYADPATLGPSGGPLTLDKTTVEHYATIFAIAPSRHDPSTIWVGSDDGLVHLTRDGGAKWVNVTPPGVPKFSRIHFIEASPHRPGKAYVAVTRYRMQDVAPYIWKTEDYGATWTNIVAGIRHGDHVRGVVEDPVREGLLFAGTENGVYVSFDDGASWQSLQLNLPVSPIHALTLKDNDLLVATHGRGFYVLDDITPLRQLTRDVVAARAHLFRPADAIRSAARPTEGDGRYIYRRAKPISGARFYYHLGEPARHVELEILDEHGTLVRRLEALSGAQVASQQPVRRFGSIPEVRGGGPQVGRAAPRVGLNLFYWDLRYPGPTTFPGMILRFAGTNGPMAPPGIYQARLLVDGRVVGTESFRITKDPRLADVTPEDFQEQFRLAMQIRDKVSEANEAVLLVRAIRQQIDQRLERNRDPATRRAAEALKERIGKVEGAIYETRLQAREDALNFGVKLNNDLAVLLLEVETADARPNAQEYEAFQYLSAELATLLTQLEEALRDGLGTLNKLLEGQGLEPIARPQP